MSASRFSRFALIACMAVAAGASPPAASGQDCTVNDTVRVTLSKTDTGQDKIVDGCWMPSVAAASKVLCAHDIEKPHTFTFSLENQCNLDVRLSLIVSRGSIKMQRPGQANPADDECNDGVNKFLFAGYLSANSGKQAPQCATKPHSNWFKSRKKGSYALAATHVRRDGVEVKLRQPVVFDPEIIIEDNGRYGGQFLILGAIALAFLYAIYRAIYGRTRRA